MTAPLGYHQHGIIHPLLFKWDDTLHGRNPAKQVPVEPRKNPALLSMKYWLFNPYGLLECQ